MVNRLVFIFILSFFLQLKAYEINPSSNGIVQKEVTTTTTLGLNPNIQDEIESTINQMNLDRQKRAAEFKTQVETLKKKAAKAGLKLQNQK